MIHTFQHGPSAKPIKANLISVDLADKIELASIYAIITCGITTAALSTAALIIQYV